MSGAEHVVHCQELSIADLHPWQAVAGLDLMSHPFTDVFTTSEPQDGVVQVSPRAFGKTASLSDRRSFMRAVRAAETSGRRGERTVVVGPPAAGAAILLAIAAREAGEYADGVALFREAFPTTSLSQASHEAARWAASLAN